MSKHRLRFRTPETPSLSEPEGVSNLIAEKLKEYNWKLNRMAYAHGSQTVSGMYPASVQAIQQPIIWQDHQAYPLKKTMKELAQELVDLASEKSYKAALEFLIDAISRLASPDKHGDYR